MVKVGLNAPLPQVNSANELRTWLISRIATEVDCTSGAIDPAMSFSRIGLDSVSTVSLTAEIEALLGRPISPNLLVDLDTIDSVVAHLLKCQHDGEDTRDTRIATKSPCLSLDDFHDWTSPLTHRVRGWRVAGKFPYEPVIRSVDGAWAEIDGRKLLVMASYSYLGLNCHPRICAAAHNAIDRFGAGAAGTRLIGGTTSIHCELENCLARFRGTEAAIVFSSGYVANVATISTLVGPGDCVIGDGLNHASIVDGCRFSGAGFYTFDHGDLNSLSLLLSRFRHAKKLVVVDAVFSMTGEIAPLPEIVRLCREHGARIMVDEAHSMGVLGGTGRGLLEHFGMAVEDVDVHMGTLSKAIPSCGGYVAGSLDLVDALKYNARGWIFSGAITPAQAASALAGVAVIDEEPERLATLRENISRYVAGLRREGFAVGAGVTPIVPIDCPSEQAAFEMARQCGERGLLIFPIVHPAVPRTNPLVRTCVSALHLPDDIDFAVSVLSEVGLRVGAISRNVNNGKANSCSS